MSATSNRIEFDASTCRPSADCTQCGCRSSTVHSRYQRRIADLAVAGREVVIRLMVRRFRCPDSQCERRIFSEQVSELVARYQRRSPLVTELLTRIGLALGGRPGARMTQQLSVEVSRSTLLRLVRAVPLHSTGTLVEIGVDDFAIRRGHNYGSVVIDMLTHRPVDLLPDRTSDTFAAWLANHPNIRIVCRDRGGPYADGARRGAPNAIQIADRWHLLHNLTAAVDKVVRAHRKCLREHDEHTAVGQPAPSVRTDGQASGRRAEATRKRHAEIHALIAKGVGPTAISKALHLDGKTVRRYALAATPELLLTTVVRRGSSLDEHVPYLAARWEEGCRNARILFREVRDRGYRGSERSVRRLIHTWREAMGPATVLTAPPPITPRQFTGWLMRPRHKLTTDEITDLQRILDRCATLRELERLVTGFADMLRHRHGHLLDAWIAEAAASDLAPLRSFAAGLVKDYDAVRNGLTLPQSSGAVEGTVTRIKSLKRSMFGRANFDLLRQRVLAR
ncbi:ISL3 family transposase [Nocardia sp. NPDC059154]|uniref:ISL3 family transposase n=1 Tax=Nocardia sp. NPDC059154 TaxID=3346744 RepID=UPI0036B3C02B